MRRVFGLLILVSLVFLPVLGEEPVAATPPAEPSTAPVDPAPAPVGFYGTFWNPPLCEAEWSPYLIPTAFPGPWDPFGWGFFRLRYWLEFERYGWAWPPNWNPIGWGWDSWYGGWYGWVPYWGPAAMGNGPWGSMWVSVVPPLEVAPTPPTFILPVKPKPTRPVVLHDANARPNDGRGSRVRPDSDARGAAAGGGFSARPAPQQRWSPPPSPPPSSGPVYRPRPPVRRR